MRPFSRLAIFALAASALGVRPARAEGDAGEMLRRAKTGLPAAAGDRELAGDLLRQWRESEAVSSRPGDQALGRALESVSVGRRLAPDERAAFERYDETRRRSRTEGGGGSAAGPEALPPGHGPGEPVRRTPPYRAPAFWIAAAAGAAVVAGGLLWILVAGRFSRR